jgi:hypothetical protein
MRSVAVQGQTAWVADWTGGFFAIDVSNPENPVIIDSTDTSGRAVDVLTAGAYSFLADYGGGLEIYTGP